MLNKFKLFRISMVTALTTVVALLIVIIIVSSQGAAVSASSNTTWRRVVYINGVTVQQGNATDPVTGISIPNKKSITVMIAKPSTAGAYGRLAYMDANWQVRNSSVVQLNWSEIRTDSAKFKFRTPYRSLIDWMIFTLTPNRNASGALVSYSITISYTNFSGTPYAGASSTSTLNPGDVSLTP